MNEPYPSGGIYRMRPTSDRLEVRFLVSKQPPGEPTDLRETPVCPHGSFLPGKQNGGFSLSRLALCEQPTGRKMSTRCYSRKHRTEGSLMVSTILRLDVNLSPKQVSALSASCHPTINRPLYQPPPPVGGMRKPYRVRILMRHCVSA